MMKHNVVWCYLTLFFLLLFVSMPMSVTEQGTGEIIVSPESFKVNLTGGDTVIKNITVRWTGDNSIQCFISTNITSDCPGNDSEGIYVTYSVDSFNLMPDIDYTVNMTIIAAVNIMPGVYTIITTIFSEGWDVTLNFNEPGGSYLIFGEAPDANDGAPPDNHDAPKPPASPSPPYIWAWFDDSLPTPYNFLWRDYRSYPDTYKVWNLTVQWVEDDETTVNISWDISEFDDCEYTSVFLYDAGGPPTNMLTQNSYSFTCPAMVPQNFKIICGSNVANDPDDDDDDDGNGGDSGGRSSPSDILPVADASAGEPYQGYINSEIIFDGSNSFDDGTITEWFWNFGDGTNGTGETTTHIYSEEGVYNVTLTVKDDQGYTDTYETTVIIMRANRPPSAPEITGMVEGSKNIVYDFTAVSTDLDNNLIEYTFDWDDGTISISGFLPNGTICTATHSWAPAGIYIVSVTAYDNKTYSGATQLTVLIDVHYVGKIGYLIDDDSDGIYDLFFCNATGNKTIVELQENGNYLIDSDGDGLWDYEYDPWTGLLIQYSDEEEPSDDEIDDGLWYLVGVIVILLTVVLIMIWREKKKKNINK